MMFIFLDHLMTGLCMVVVAGVAWFTIDLVRYVFGGDTDE